MAIEWNPGEWNLESSVAQGREGTGFAQILKQPTLKELSTSPYEALAKKAAAAKKTEFKPIDVNPTNPIVEDQENVNNQIKDFYKMQSEFYNKGYTPATHPDEYAAIQQQKQRVENTAMYSNEYGKREADLIKKINENPYDYPPDAAERLFNNRNIALFDANGNRVQNTYNDDGEIETQGTRELNPENLLPKIDKINVAKEVKIRGYDSYYRKALANWNGEGGGKSTTEFVFDEAEAGRSYDNAKEYDLNKGYMVKITKRAAKDAQSEYDNQQAKANSSLRWNDLSTGEKDNLVDIKRKGIYVQTLRDLAKDDISEVNKANRVYHGRSKTSDDSVIKSGYKSYGFTKEPDGTYRMITTVSIPPVATKTGADAANPLNTLNDGSGNTMPYKVEFTGKVRRTEGGEWMVEYMALEDGYNLAGNLVKKSKIYYTPYSQNRKLLKKFGYQDIDEVAPPDERAAGYEDAKTQFNQGIGFPTPDQWNASHTAAKDSDKKKYKEWYEKNVAKRKAGYKNTSDAKLYTAERKKKAEESINDQVASLNNQEKKVGTYNPSTGQIDFA